MFSKRKGFTLVELLIVIIVIGILAGGMMLASGSASDSARASTLISELRNAKAAGIFWFADNTGSPDLDLQAAWGDQTDMVSVFQLYMDNPTKAAELVFETYNSDGVNYLVGKSADARVITKALGQAKGILMDSTGAAATSGSGTVFMRVR